MNAPIPNFFNNDIPKISIIQKVETPSIEKTSTPTSRPDYIIKSGDSLTSISELSKVPVARLWSANADLTHPDLIEPDKPLKIPQDSDVLPAREMPASQSWEPTATSLPNNTNSGRLSSSGGGYTANRFEWGWCTFFASQQRPDLAVTGNAADWIRWSNSTTPRVGAVAVNTSGLGHVAIVLDFNASQVLVRHMNWHGFGVISEDWIPLSYWSGYIL